MAVDASNLNRLVAVMRSEPAGTAGGVARAEAALECSLQAAGEGSVHGQLLLCECLVRCMRGVDAEAAAGRALRMGGDPEQRTAARAFLFAALRLQMRDRDAMAVLQDVANSGPLPEYLLTDAEVDAEAVAEQAADAALRKLRRRSRSASGSSSSHRRRRRRRRHSSSTESRRRGQPYHAWRVQHGRRGDAPQRRQRSRSPPQPAERAAPAYLTD
eukprot:TRINITY_DN7671_c0_g1_i1.p1 TRINITY_DN7671_c0_g1~~TRINITY_DN7671_c0_g1_i1.p1  ORF type:complete len:244 (+),score=75.58 TRINITY_DN7671_c0_g1_i1:88-732(+)